MRKDQRNVGLTKQEQRLAFSKLARFVIIVVTALAPAAATQTHAATETGEIAVLDFVIPGLFPGDFDGVENQMMRPRSLDPTGAAGLDTSEADVTGTLNVYQNHGTPLRNDNTLSLRRIRATPAVISGVKIEMHRRGASSATFPKKSYALEFKDSPSPFLEAGKDWVLHSCYTDSTCLRNVIVYWQASKLFPWAPHTEFAEVFINGYYRGLYVVIEKIKLAPERVDLPNPTDNRITGGYVLEAVPPGNADAHWTSKVAIGGSGSTNGSGFPTVWSIVAPKKSLTEAQRSYIQTFMDDSFEPRFNVANGAYDAFNYNKYLAESSAVDFIIMQELSRNVDAFGRSMHITKYPVPVDNKRPRDLIPERRQTFDGLVHMGPVWDFDLAFGHVSPEFCVAESAEWRIDESTAAEVYQPLWETWKKPDFRRAMLARWQGLRADGTISPDGFDAQIDALYARIVPARARDNKVWKTLEALDVALATLLTDPAGGIPWPLWECRDYSLPTSFQAEIATLKQFVRARIDWIDAKIANNEFLAP